MKKYIVADGGGTKTKYILIDENRNELFSLTGPGTNPVHIGEETAKSLLISSMETLLKQSGTAENDIAGAALFVPVLWRSCSGLEDRFRFPCPILSDTEAAVWAALSGRDGLVVLSGTGSFVRGKHKGAELLVGGWGYAFGDEGSGYALGIAALKYASHCFDAGLAEDELIRGIMAHYGINSIDGLKAKQKEPDMLKVSSVAALCPLLERAARNNCPAAVEIIRGQALALASQAALCAERLGFDKALPLPIALTGGVLTNNPEIRRSYESAIRTHFPRAEIFLSVREPAEGAKDYITAGQTGK